MRYIAVNLDRAGFDQRFGGLAKRSGRVTDVIDDDALAPLHVTDDGHAGNLTGLLAPLVDDGQRCIDPFRQFPRAPRRQRRVKRPSAPPFVL